MDYQAKINKIKKDKSKEILQVRSGLKELMSDIDDVLDQKALQSDTKELLEQQRDKLSDIDTSLQDIPVKFTDSIKELIEASNEAFQKQAVSTEAKFNEMVETVKSISPEVIVKAPIIPEPTVIKEDNVFNKYKPADIVEDNNTKYYGYLSNSGEWFVIREVETDNTTKYRYASGSGHYDFTKRDKLSYKYYSDIKL